MKTLLGIIAILTVIVILIFFSRNYFKNSFLSGQRNTTAVIKNHSFNLLVASDDRAKQIGLSGRSSIASDSGMVFPFDKAWYWPFWMKNMQFPIDIVYLQNKHIITIYENVPNPTASNANLPIYTPKKPADMVLEVKAGLCHELDLKEGDTVSITL